MGGGGIQGGGSQGGGNVHQGWEQQYVGQGAQLDRQVKKFEQKRQTQGPRQKDALEKSVQADRKGDVTTVEGKEQAKQAGKPLSLKSDNPRLFDPDNHASNPPSGPQGTGNPFFNVNPMATFFGEFLKMMAMQKQMQLATNKLAVTDSKLIMDLAKSQANAIIKEADAQATSLEKQAIASFVQAGLGGLQLLGSVYGGFQAAKEMRQARKAQARATATAKKTLDSVEEGSDVAKQASKISGKLTGQKNNLKTMQRAPTEMSDAQFEKMHKMRQAEHKEAQKFAKNADNNNLKMAEQKKSKLNQQRADDLKTKEKQLKIDKDLKKGSLEKSNKEIDDLDEKIAQTADKKARSKLEKEKDDALDARKIESKEQRELREKEGELEYQTKDATTKKMEEFNDKVDDFNYKIARMQKGNKKVQADLKNANDKLIKLENDMKLPGKDTSKIQGEITKIKAEKKMLEKHDKVTKDAIKNLKADKDKYIQGQAKSMEDDIKKTEKELSEVSTKFQKDPKYQEARAKYDEELTKLQNYDRSAATQAMQNMQGKPWFMGLQAFTQSATHTAEGFSKRFQAEGTREAAQWEARKAELQAHQQIMQAAMNAMTEMTRDNYQQANELAQTLIKMSDQEAQSMHWAA